MRRRVPRVTAGLVAGAGLAAGLSALPAASEVTTTRYSCERGVEVPVTYVNGTDGEAVVVLTVEGAQITLVGEPAASGARYAWPSGGSGYVWWTKGHAATLYWRDGETTIEEPVYSDCRQRD